MGERLFPEREPYDGDDWQAAGQLPELPPVVHRRPDADRYEAPPVVTPPG